MPEDGYPIYGYLADGVTNTARDPPIVNVPGEAHTSRPKRPPGDGFLVRDG
jgi:hypothetical protein